MRPGIETSEVDAPRHPRFIGGNWKAISEAFGMTPGMARKWYDRGAPIIKVNNRPVAEAWELWCWLKEEYG